MLSSTSSSSSSSSSPSSLLLSLSHLSSLLYTLREIAWSYTKADHQNVFSSSDIIENAKLVISLEREIVNKLTSFRISSIHIYDNSSGLHSDLVDMKLRILFQTWTFIEDVLKSFASGIVFSLSFSQLLNNQTRANNKSEIDSIETNEQVVSVVDNNDDDVSTQLDTMIRSVSDDLLNKTCAFITTLLDPDSSAYILQLSSKQYFSSSSSSLVMITLTQQACLESLLVLVRNSENDASTDILGAIGRLQSVIRVSNGEEEGSGEGNRVQQKSQQNSSKNKGVVVSASTVTTLKNNSSTSGGFVSVRRRPSSSALPPDSPSASRTDGIASLMLTMSPLQGAVAPGRLRAVNGGGSAKGIRPQSSSTSSRHHSKMASSLLTKKNTIIPRSLALEHIETHPMELLSSHTKQQQEQTQTVISSPHTPNQGFRHQYPSNNSPSGPSSPSNGFQIDKHLNFLDVQEKFENFDRSHKQENEEKNSNTDGMDESNQQIDQIIQSSHSSQTPTSTSCTIYDKSEQIVSSSTSSPPSLSNFTNKSSQKAHREIDRARILLLEKYSLPIEAVEGVLLAHTAGLVVWSDTFIHSLLTISQDMTEKKIEDTTRVPPLPSTNIVTNIQSVGSEVHTQIHTQLQPQTQTVNVVTHLGWQKIAPNNEFKTAAELMKLAKLNKGVSNEGTSRGSGVLMSPIRSGPWSQGQQGLEKESPYRTYTKR
jgi:hypothetical protein